jgi:P4 family phage/plasmid primase-like protien
MRLKEFDSIVGQDSYVRCSGKKRIDSAIVDYTTAKNHVASGGQIGWWVRSGYIVVDIDEGKKEALQVIKRLGLNTLMCKTPKGLHLYFKTDRDFPQRVGMVLPCGLKCDFRCANKGYVLLPWGTESRAFNKLREVAELPLEFTPIINRKESLLGLKDGDGRNATLFGHLMAYKNRGATEAQIDDMAHAINDVVFNDPMDETELQKIINNTKRYEAQEQGENPYLIYNSKGTPTGINARAICDYFVNRGDVFVLGGECFQYRDGVYVEASSYVRNTIREMILLDNFITQARIMEVYRLIIDDTRIQKITSELNTNKKLINFKNGVWDMERMELLPHDSKYLQTVQIPHPVGQYKPFTETRLYQFFKLTKLKKEDIKMILDYMAYCLTLDYGLKTFMILCGQSNTGKSVLLRFIETMIGRENTSALSMHELSQRFYPSQLYNRLLNSCGDNGSLPLSSIENLKKITGGDQIMHEKKGKEPFFFVPYCKLIFSFNQLPLQLEEKSNAFYKRMRILYMNNELFLNNEYVNELCSEESVAEVIPYLLSLLPVKEIPRTRNSNRLVEGLRQDSDSIHAFLKKKCATGAEYSVKKEALYEAYLEFCMKSGRESHKKHGFMRNMRSLGFTEGRSSKGSSRELVWNGVTLKEYLKKENHKGG